MFWRLKVLLRVLKLVKRRRKAKKIPSYLQKTYAEELNYKLWITKGARFAASLRNEKLERLSSQSIGYFSAYLILINILNLYELPFYEKLDNGTLGLISTGLSIIILVFSQFEISKQFGLNAYKFHKCGLEIAELYNELRMVKTFQDIKSKDKKVESISKRYDEVLKRYPNHSHIDGRVTTLAKNDYHHLTVYQKRLIQITAYTKTSLVYHILLIVPPFSLILFQFFG